MALGLATIVTSIAALSVTGLTIKDMDEIPAEVKGRKPMLIPNSDFLSDFELITQSFGPGSTAKYDVLYTLSYRLCYKPIGAGRPLEYFDDMVLMVGLFLDAIIAANPLSGSIRLVPLSVSGMGNVEDPSGFLFHGCDIGIRVMEFVN